MDDGYMIQKIRQCQKEQIEKNLNKVCKKKFEIIERNEERNLLYLLLTEYFREVEEKGNIWIFLIGYLTSEFPYAFLLFTIKIKC